jgi:O-antigen/teichoic acid export membrane protein
MSVGAVARLYALAAGIQGRDRRTLLTAGSSIVARLVALSVTLLTVRISIGYLGATRYGLWATITSLTALLAFSDLGIGNAIINRMSVAYASDERERATREVSSATALLGVIAVALVALAAVMLAVLPWSRIYNVSGLAAAEAGPATLAVIVCFAALIPLGLVQKVQLGFQQGAISNLWLIGGSVLSLVFLLLAIELKAGLPWLVLGVAGGPVVTTALNWIQEFVFSKPWLRPRPDRFELGTGLALARTGLLFLGLQVAAAVAFSSDNLIAAQLLGQVAVAQYSVTQRVFLVVPALLSVAAVSLWPAYGEALHRADRPWIRRMLVRSTLVAVALTLAGSLLIVVGSRWIFGFLLGPALLPSLALLLGFVVWSLLYAFGNVASMLLNAANVIVFQLVIASLMAVAAIGLKIELGRAYGVAGIIWGTVIAYGLIAVVPTLLYLRHRRRVDW